ncbi:MAG: serine/threonine protein kinase [Candidatus Thiodiazotropha endolucinida]|uniref:Serine/threonine protein kinase n=1 Tax=Candidatus Thiodiazotropha taylori TaxID=2792791 RepID=A0A9E4KCN3_9GAMM|nr:serine/threonine protein kinase [Candidatus Thiodiazotropha taylori]
MNNSTDLTSIANQICTQKKYTLIKPIAEGGFKRTFHVQDNKGLPLALKLLKPNTDMMRLDREIEAMLQCQHPNIGSLIDFDSFTSNSYTHNYIVEPYADGGSLMDRLQAMGHLDCDAVIKLAISLSDAIGYLSELKLVHRDIKPDNIMFLDNTDDPILLDFGIVRDLDVTSLTKTFFIRGPGTPYYAAPEQLNNQKELIDWRTDQYALGITLAKCIYDVHPYSEENEQGPLQAIERVAQYQNPSNKFTQFCAQYDLKPLVKMIAPYPVLRFTDAGLLKSAWERLL